METVNKVLEIIRQYEADLMSEMTAVLELGELGYSATEIYYLLAKKERQE